jgi:hypothetical protein
MQTNKTKQRIIILVILLLVVAAIIYIRVQRTKQPNPVTKSESPIDITPLIISKLQQLVKDGSDGLYQLSIEQLKPDLTSSQVDIIKAKIVPDSAALQKLDALQKAPDDVFTISFDSLHITGVNVTDFIHTKNVSVDTILVSTPFIQVAHTDRPYNAVERAKDSSLTLYQKLTKQFTSIAINSIVVKEGTLTSINLSQKKKTVRLKGIEIHVNDLKIDSLTQYDKDRFLFSKNAAFSCKDYVASTADSLYIFKVGSFAVAADKHTLIAKEVALQPRGDKETFEKKLKHRSDMFTIRFPEIICRNLNWWALLNSQRLYAAEVVVRNGSIKDYLNRALPSGPKGRKDNFPQQLLMYIPSKIEIQKLRVEGLDVSYEEYNPHSDKAGKLTFNNIDGTIEHITNIPAQMKAHPLTICTADGLFMNKVPITARFEFNLTKLHSGAFSTYMHIGALANTLINPIAEPMGMFTLKSGKIKEATVKVTGDNDNAATNITMLYNDLKIFPLKNDGGTGHLKKEGLVGFFANTFMIKDANPTGNQTPRSPEVTTPRGDPGSFFNFLWKATLNGIERTIGIPK